MKNKYKFSVIMPIYNTAKYLPESIDSIINQTLDFHDNIQLIIVNDGSSDSSHTICQSYQSRYPDNIIYLQQEHAGAAKARNTGIPFISGEYVNFFDSDDIWEQDAFEKAYNFICQNSSLIDVVSCVQKFFELKTGFHNLNNKFKDGSRVINIHDTPQYIQLSTASSFISAEAVKRYRFDPQLAIGEDAKFITDIILEKESYGVLSDVTYNIRKRFSGDSATQNPPVTKYTNTIEYYYKYLPVLSMQKYGKLIPYMQHIMINGLKYRAISSAPIPLKNAELDKYINDVTDLIKLIDDEVILTTNQLMAPGKMFLLKLKYGNIPSEYISIKNNLIYFKSHFLGYINIDKIFIDYISILDTVITIKGHLDFPLEGDLQLSVCINDFKSNVDLVNCTEYDRLAFNGDKIISGRTFSLTGNLNSSSNKISFVTEFNGIPVNQNLSSPSNKTQIANGDFELDQWKILLQKNSLLVYK